MPHYKVNAVVVTWKSVFRVGSDRSSLLDAVIVTNMARLAFSVCGFWLMCHPYVGLQKAYVQNSSIQKFALIEERYTGKYEDLQRDGYVTVDSIG
jgi:hypothetical protein